MIVFAIYVPAERRGKADSSVSKLQSMWVNEVPVIKLIVASSHPLFFANKALNIPKLGRLNLPLYFSVHAQILTKEKKKNPVKCLFLSIQVHTVNK